MDGVLESDPVTMRRTGLPLVGDCRTTCAGVFLLIIAGYLVLNTNFGGSTYLAESGPVAHADEAPADHGAGRATPQPPAPPLGQTPQPPPAPTAPRPTLTAEDEEAGFLSSEEPLPPEPQDLPAESDAELRELNAPYHARRRALREHQRARGLGPLQVHTFFTVDCTQHSLWQVLALELSWHRVRQGGFITRVISGCRAGDETTAMWQRGVLPPAVAALRSGSYFAPTFSTLPNGEYYAPFNRPNAIWHWLNHTDLTERVFVALDPDMIFMHRLHVAAVQPGRPVAQHYGYMSGAPYDTYRCPLCPPDPQSAYHGGGANKKENYDVGPPWMFHISDLRLLVPTWVALVPMLRAIDPKSWIAEMVAYTVAAAFHRRPHQLIYHGMVDNVRQPGAWDERTDALLDASALTRNHKLALLHYCFTWEVGEVAPRTPEGGGVQHERMVRRERQQAAPVLDYYHWSKYRTPSDWPGGKGRYPHNVFQCSCPLLQEFRTARALPPHEDHAVVANWQRTMHFYRRALPVLNEALTLWKLHVANCSVPTEEEAADFEAAAARYRRGEPTADPTSVRAHPRHKRIINLAEQLRTSHPTYWISDYVITKFEDDQKTVQFVNASVARSAIWQRLRGARG